MTRNRIIAAFYTLVLLAGVALYVGWGYYYNAWTDIGLYAISAVLIGFGLIGTLLYGKEPKKCA
jgi:membrane protease YdiL (CAAX protease family)